MSDNIGMDMVDVSILLNLLQENEIYLMLVSHTYRRKRKILQDMIMGTSGLIAKNGVSGHHNIVGSTQGVQPFGGKTCLTEFLQNTSGKQTLECVVQTLWRSVTSFDHILKNKQHE